MNLERERELFEDWYDKAYLNTDIGYLMHNGQYSSRRKQHSWDAWLASASRDGYKLVPVEPTWEMIDAGENSCYGDDEDIVKKVYKAMLGAVDET